MQPPSPRGIGTRRGRAVTETLGGRGSGRRSTRAASPEGRAPELGGAASPCVRARRRGVCRRGVGQQRKAKCEDRGQRWHDRVLLRSMTLEGASTTANYSPPTRIAGQGAHRRGITAPAATALTFQQERSSSCRRESSGNGCRGDVDPGGGPDPRIALADHGEDNHAARFFPSSWRSGPCTASTGRSSIPPTPFARSSAAGRLEARLRAASPRTATSRSRPRSHLRRWDATTRTRSGAP